MSGPPRTSRMRSAIVAAGGTRFESFRGGNYFPADTADTTAITGLSGTGKWLGGVLAPNGKIYGIPLDATSVLIIDPASNTANTTAITGLSGREKWIGGVLAPNGKIYGIPLQFIICPDHRSRGQYGRIPPPSPG